MKKLLGATHVDARKVVVELDLSNLDEDIKPEQIKEISITYYNLGEDQNWTETVPFRILAKENERV